MCDFETCLQLNLSKSSGQVCNFFSHSSLLSFQETNIVLTNFESRLWNKIWTLCLTKKVMFNHVFVCV